MLRGIFLLLVSTMPDPGPNGGTVSASVVLGADEREPDFCDRLHQTFLLLNEGVLPAYVEHFNDEPEKQAVVHYYLGRLAMVENDTARAHGHFLKCFQLAEPDSYYAFYSSSRLKQSEYQALASSFTEAQAIEATYSKLYEANWGKGPQAWMRSAQGYVERTDIPDATDYARYFINKLGFQPHIVLQRGQPVPAPDELPEQWSHSPLVARCPLYDPQLIWVYRRLGERAAGNAAQAGIRDVPSELARAQIMVRDLRAQADNQELSLRKFLDKHSLAVWRLGWMYRCLGVEQERTGDVTVAHENYGRAWAIGDALFPVSERGRLDRFDRVFLAELGDVYARLGRYDLMLRYMYSDQGLPARFEIAKPIAELARVAASVRLARHDESAAEQLDEVLPETVSQILFEQPVMPPAPAAEKTTTDSKLAVRVGWVLMGIGGVVLLVAVVWRLIRTTRRTAMDRTKTVSPLMNSPD